MRARWFLSIVAIAMLLASCGQGTGSGTQPRGPADLLILRSTDGLTAVDSASGSVLADGEAGPILAGTAELFAAQHLGGGTTIRAFEADTGHPLDQLHLKGNLAIRVVSADGSRLALMAPLPSGASPWVPEPRAFTDITVADVGDAKATQSFHLEGNFEPEAFATNGALLFMIKYVPATAPTAYRVVGLNLAKGTVSPIYGRAKSPPETMSGTRLMQTPSSDGTTLFTLYTSQPASYAEGYDAWQAKSAHAVAFVHTLSLSNGWAVCVPLPGPFGNGDPSDEAMAASPDGSLYVVDTEKGLISVMDPEKLRVIRTAHVDFGPSGAEQTHATVSPDGRRLMVSTGSTIVTIDTGSLERLRSWDLPAVIEGLGFSADGKRLYAVADGEVRVLDASSGQEIRMLRTPGVTGLEYVGALDR